MTSYYPARDGHPSMFAFEDSAGALSGKPILCISRVSGSVDGANDTAAQDAPMLTTCREAVTPLAAAAALSAAGRTQLSPERRRILKMLDDAGSRGCREGFLLLLGFGVGILSGLVHDGLARATARVRTGGARRFRITAEGQRAIEE